MAASRTRTRTGTSIGSDAQFDHRDYADGDLPPEVPGIGKKTQLTPRQMMEKEIAQNPDREAEIRADWGFPAEEGDEEQSPEQ